MSQGLPDLEVFHIIFLMYLDNSYIKDVDVRVDQTSIILTMFFLDIDINSLLNEYHADNSAQIRVVRQLSLFQTKVVVVLAII